MTRNGPAWGPGALERAARVGLIRTSALLAFDRVVVDPDQLVRVALATNGTGAVVAKNLEIIGIWEVVFHLRPLYRSDAITKTPGHHFNMPSVRRLWPRTQLG